jgi:hypothetical protein
VPSVKCNPRSWRNVSSSGSSPLIFCVCQQLSSVDCTGATYYVNVTNAKYMVRCPSYLDLLLQRFHRNSPSVVLLREATKSSDARALTVSERVQSSTTSYVRLTLPFKPIHASCVCVSGGNMCGFCCDKSCVNVCKSIDLALSSASCMAVSSGCQECRSIWPCCKMRLSMRTARYASSPTP